ncbi:MAG: ABC transporter ATP-binding protein [Porticoccaceae bacterium]|nr:ABC transporter ATP-binding protein [Porticoccaceae bacterium]
MNLFSSFEKLVNPFPPESPKTPPNTLYKFCRHYTQGMEWALVLMAVLSAVIAILEVVLFSFMGDLVDWLSTQSPDNFLQENQRALIGMAVMLVIVIPVLSLLHGLISHQTLIGNFPMVIRWLGHRYLLKQSMSFFQNEFGGRLATKIMQTSLAVRESVMKLMDILVYVCVYIVSIVFLFLQTDWRLAIPLLVWLVIYISILCKLIPKLRDISAKQADARAVMTGRVVDSYTNISTVKLFSHAQRETNYARESMDGFLKTVHPQMRLVTLLDIAVDISYSLLVFSIAAVSIWLWLQGQVSAGAIAVAIALALRLNGMSHWVMWETSSLFENIGTVQDGMNTLSREVSVKDVANADELHTTEGKISFKEVQFAYGDNPDIFENLNLEIAAGEKIGLVGRSGAGKSTLVNLLLRFHDLQAGAIEIDGQDIGQVTQESLRAAVGMVTQDTSLMHRSVSDNIYYGRGDASEAEMIEAARKAEAYDFIQGLEDIKGNKNFDAMVGERGVNLSGGQRQRIAIARVMLKNAPILVLDEATSALDSEAEAAIQKSLNRLMENKTVIAIAHRLSTIAMMDRLLVLDEGKIVESGTHQELIELGGIYATLWAHQSGGFIGLD